MVSGQIKAFKVAPDCDGLIEAVSLQSYDQLLDQMLEVGEVAA